MSASERTERNHWRANAWANAIKALPLLAPNTTNTTRTRTTREAFTHTGEDFSTCDSSRACLGAFVVLVVFAGKRHAGLRAFACAFAHQWSRSLARARLFLLLII